MNSRDRRTVDRLWPHGIYLENDLADECFPWLKKNFGSCSFKRRRMPRWCWRPDMLPGPNFTMYQGGVSLYLRKERDYLAFLLRWNR